MYPELALPTPFAGAGDIAKFTRLAVTSFWIRTNLRTSGSLFLLTTRFGWERSTHC